MYSKGCLMIVVIASLLQMVVDGFSTGAAGCGPAPSVSGVHLQASATKTVANYQWSTSLKPVNFKVGDTVVAEGGSFTVKALQNTEIKVVGINGNAGIKGVLFRLSAGSEYDLTGAILPGESTKSAGACKSPIVGVTHIAANDKPEVSAILKLPNKVGQIKLDVTAVFFNSDTVSQYTNATFTIDVTGCKFVTTGGFFARLFGRGKRVCK